MKGHDHPHEHTWLFTVQLDLNAMSPLVQQAKEKTGSGDQET